VGAFLTKNFPTRVRGSGQGFAYTIRQLLQAALAGHGLAYVSEGMVEAHVAKGRSSAC
jgi:hypothetical protein